jgi:hypothetical protein
MVSTTWVRITGRALLFAFVATIAAALFPLELGSSEWGRRLSTLIVDASSLPLVGLALLRYLAYSEKTSGLGPASSDQGDHPLSGDHPKGDRKARLNPFEFQVSIGKGAYAGFVGLVLLAIWQVILWVTALDGIDSQGLQATVRIQRQTQALQERFQRAADAEIEQAWSNLETSKAPLLGDPSPGPEVKRKDVIARIKIEERLALKNADEAVTKQKFVLTRDCLRIILLAIIYAWAFYGIAKL